MRIPQIDLQKKMLLKFLGAYHRFARSRNQIRSDLQNCGDEFTRELLDVIDTVNSRVESPYHRTAIQDLAELGLFSTYKDTAYRDVGRGIVREILKRKERIEALLKDEPEDFMYVNAWYRRLRMQGHKLYYDDPKDAQWYNKDRPEQRPDPVEETE